MNAKQTPLVDILRLHAEDLHSDYGHNKSARLLSQAADEIAKLSARNAELLQILQNTAEASGDERDELRATISRLRDALSRYAYHEEDCAAVDRGLSNCDCGYDELMAELEETK